MWKSAHDAATSERIDRIDRNAVWNLTEINSAQVFFFFFHVILWAWEPENIPTSVSWNLYMSFAARARTKSMEVDLKLLTFGRAASKKNNQTNEKQSGCRVYFPFNSYGWFMPLLHIKIEPYVLNVITAADQILLRVFFCRDGRCFVVSVLLIFHDRCDKCVSSEQRVRTEGYVLYGTGCIYRASETRVELRSDEELTSCLGSILLALIRRVVIKNVTD